MSFKTFFESYAVRKIMVLTGFIIFGIVMSIGIPLFLGFAAKGFEGGFTGEFMSKYVFYYGLVFASILIIISLTVREIILSYKNKNVENFRRVTPFSTVILHDPMEDGLLGTLAKKTSKDENKKSWFEKAVRWITSPVRLFLLSVIIFSIVGLGSGLTNTFFVKAPNVEMQATETAQIYFSAEPASFGETMFHIALLALQYGLLLYFCRRINLSFAVFLMLALLILPVVGGLEWMAMHILRYGARETDLVTTFIFGYVGYDLTIASGSFIPWYVWHFDNNMFRKMFCYTMDASGKCTSQIASDEKITIITIAVLTLILIAWISVEILIAKSKKKAPETVDIVTSV
jgi:hypothetical protein